MKVKVGMADKTKLIPDENETAVVKKIFEMAVGGQGGKEITKALNNAGIRTRSGTQFSTTSVNHILRNEVYTGALVWRFKNKGYGNLTAGASNDIIRVPNCHEAIISIEDFNRVQQLLTKRRPISQHPRTISSQYLLSGLLHCGKCGAAMSGCWAKSGKYFYYECIQHQKKGRGVCNCRLIGKDKLEDFVLERIRENILTDENIRQLVRLVNEELVKNSGLYEEQLGEIGQQLGQVQGRLSKLYAALETGNIDLEDLAPRIKELRAQQNELEDRRNELLDKMNEKTPESLNTKQVQEYVSSLRTLLASSSFIERKSFLRSFVKRIELDEPRVVIDYTMPLPINGLTTKGEVLCIDKIGSPNRSIHRTFRATFEMPVIQANQNLIKVGKRRYRNPVYLAREWQRLLKNGECSSPAALSRYLQVSRARVTQVLNLLQLSPEVVEMISSLGDPLGSPVIVERRLRPLLMLNAEQQKKQVGIMLQ